MAVPCFRYLVPFDLVAVPSLPCPAAFIFAWAVAMARPGLAWWLQISFIIVLLQPGLDHRQEDRLSSYCSAPPGKPKPIEASMRLSTGAGLQLPADVRQPSAVHRGIHCPHARYDSLVAEFCCSPGKPTWLIISDGASKIAQAPGRSADGAAKWVISMDVRQLRRHLRCRQRGPGWIRSSPRNIYIPVCPSGPRPSGPGQAAGGHVRAASGLFHLAGGTQGIDRPLAVDGVEQSLVAGYEGMLPGDRDPAVLRRAGTRCMWTLLAGLHRIQRARYVPGRGAGGSSATWSTPWSTSTCRP